MGGGLGTGVGFNVGEGAGVGVGKGCGIDTLGSVAGGVVLGAGVVLAVARLRI